MRIVVNDIAASEGGALAVLNDLYEMIVEHDDKNEWIFLLSGEYLEPKKNIRIVQFPEIKTSWFKRLTFELFKGKYIIGEMNPDIYVSLQNTATLGLNIPQYVYFHQVLPYQKQLKFNLFNREENLLWLYQYIGKNIYQLLFKISNARVIVQSNWLKEEMSQHLNNVFSVSQPKVSPQIYEYEFNELSFYEKKNFFYPTSQFKYKNFEVLFEAVKLLNSRGVCNFEVYVTLDENKFEAIPNLTFLNKISRTEVYEYMANSVLVFPSLVESYGLPLLEAKIVNTYIIASDLEYAHEVLDDYKNVSFFDSKNAESLAELMTRIINNEINIDKSESSYLENNNNLLNILLGGNNEKYQ